MKEACLIIVSNPNKEKCFWLSREGAWEIGRPAGSSIPDIPLLCPTVSRRQGKLICRDGIYTYVDYNSKNGTFLNQEPVMPGLHGRVRPILLHNGDQLCFGGIQTPQGVEGGISAVFAFREMAE